MRKFHFHRWENVELEVRTWLFVVGSRCKKCGLIRAENMLTEEIKYFYGHEI